MRDRDLYANILGISALWQFSDVVLGVAAGTVEVFVEHHGKAAESMHVWIQRIKRMACGYRNRERSGTRSASNSPGRTSIRGRSQPSRSPEAPQFCCQKSAARNLTSAV
jgi:hypothetical protein